MTNEVIEYAKKRINEFVWEQKASEKLRGMDIKLSGTNAVMLSFQHPMNFKKGTMASPISTNLSLPDFKTIFDDVYDFYFSYATKFNSSSEVTDAKISNSKAPSLKQKMKTDPMYQSMKIFAPIENEKIAI